MSTLLSRLADLIDIPVQYPDLVLQEVKNKLVGTYILINDDLYYLSRMERSYIEVNNTEGVTQLNGGMINSMAVYLPDSGCYRVDGNMHYLEKIAKRQWKKSFSWGYYRLHGRDSEWDIFKIFKQSPVNMYKTNENIFYNNLLIGRRTADKWTLVAPDFQYEMDNFLKEGANAT